MTGLQALSVGHSLEFDFARTGVVHSVFAGTANLDSVWRCGRFWRKTEATFRSASV